MKNISSIRKIIVILLTLIIFISVNINSQSLTISGVVLGNNRNPIEYTTVSIMTKIDSSFVQGTITDKEGVFNTTLTNTKEDLIINFSMIGYKTLSFEITKGSEILTREIFNPILLEPLISTLSEVEVVSKKPVIEQKIDRLVLNVNQNILAKNSNLLDLLGHLPGVIIEPNGDIWVGGKSGVLLLKDERTINIGGNQLKNYLKSQSSRSIEAIELITNPSSKYDAEGTAAIINLKYKKSSYSGLLGNLYSENELGYNKNFFGGVMLEYNNKKWNFSLMGDLGTENEQTEGTSIRLFQNDNLYEEYSFDEEKKTYQSLSLSTDYEINNHMYIGMEGDFFLYNNKNIIRKENFDFLLDGDLQQTIITDQNKKTNDEDVSLNLHYNWTVDSLGSSLLGSLDYLNYNSRNYININSRSLKDAQTSQSFSDISNPTDIKVQSGKIDFKKVFRNKFSIETGVKNVKSTIVNILQVKNENLFDPKNSNSFKYQEEISAAYFVAKKETDTWGIQFGTRLENTSSKGISILSSEGFHNKYLNFFPSFHANKKLDENQQIGFSYSRRINRPRYSLLNPFTYFVTPYSSISGNSSLQPAFANSFELNYNLKGRYHARFSFSKETDVIRSITTQNDLTGLYATSFDNLDKTQNIGVNFSIPIDISDWWSIRTFTGVYWNTYENILDSGAIFKQSQGTFTFKTSHEFMLPADVLLQVSTLFASPSLYGITKLKVRKKFSFALERYFLDDLLGLTIQVYDPFNWEKEQLITEYDNQQVNSSFQYFQRGLELSLSYDFSVGREKQAKFFRKSNSEESGRIK